jgi:hypothetical protein
MPGLDTELMTVFSEALERTDPADRAAYLDGACRGNPELRRLVDELLAAHAGAGRFLEGDPTGAPEAGPFPSVAETEASPSGTTISSQSVTKGPDPDGARTTVEDRAPVRPTGAPMVGRVIAGRYTLREVLGEGGMGTVYLAEQTRPVRRMVALMLIRLGMDSRAVLARFDAERQALALMDHPNIARVYDGGATEAAQPFFVMELVQGEPITEYCDRMRLPVRARLELFVAVCQAVQHAHQKGIIHRDLKPGNILVVEVDGRPTPKVIDFGVAKAVQFKLTDQSLADTGAIVGTPTYMSPEQADPTAMDIDTRTDIYALGVILYELLAGSPPIDARQLRRGAFLEMLRMVREVDPPRPSTKVSTSEALPNIAASRGSEPEHLKRTLRGDLDWIVMKALEKDRTRRYETANGFGADILRHLANEPVLAAPPDRAYRMRKFVRKNRGAVVAVNLVLLALVGGMVGTSLGLLEARRQQGLAVAAQKAEKERAESESNERRRALQAEAETRKKADELELRLDNSNFLLAVAGYENIDIPGARVRLDGIQVKNRGWEWHYLRRECIGGLFTLYGHTGAVTSVAFSPDGTRIVSRSDDRTARVWDARTGAPLVELEGHKGFVRSVSFSPDGTRIVTGGTDQTAKVWDARTGAPLLDLKGHTGQVLSVAFSADGTRIVTGSGDYVTSRGEAKVWDARTGAPLLDLKGHTGPVRGVAFSPEASRIVTGSDDRTAKVWDARTGAPLLDLKGHTDPVTSVAFGPDGTRIVTRNNKGTASVWDARTGEELKDEPNPPATRPGQISPDGRRIAHIDGRSVEVVLLEPDEDELAYRRFFMKPDFRFYRESYDAARASKDAFLTKFYLSLFPPAEQSRIRAEEIVQPLFARLGFREDVIAVLKAQPTSDTVLQAAWLELAATRPLSAGELNNAAWPLVSASGQPEAMYQRGLHLAQTACRLEPDDFRYINTLGVAQYRAGLLAEALATFSRSQEENEDYPGDLAFMALAHHRLGQFEKARDALARLRKVMQNQRLAADPESKSFLREAEAIELDRAFPAEPFARREPLPAIEGCG